MAFEMSLPRTKRIKYISPDGTETYHEEDRWALVRSVHGDQDGESTDEEEEKLKGSKRPASSAPAQPLEALSKLHMARGEISMLLDLLDMLEAQQHLGIASVPLKEVPLRESIRSRQLQLQSKAAQLKAASDSLRKGANAMRRHLQLEDRYFGEVALLAQDWLIRPASEFNFSHGAAPYVVDLKMTEPAQHSFPSATLELVRNANGNVQVIGSSGNCFIGSSAPAAAFLGRQNELMWEGITAALREEAQSAASTSAAQALASEVINTVQTSSNPDLEELRHLLVRAYLTGLGQSARTGLPPQLLAHINSWLRHRYFSRSLWRSLQLEAARLQQAGLEVQLEPVEVPGAARSAIQAACGHQKILFVVQGDELEVRSSNSQGGARSSVATATSSGAGKHDIARLLHSLCQETV